MKTAIATTHIEVMVKCPYCNSYEDIFENDLVKEEFTRNGELRSDDIDLEHRCSECKKIFIVESIEF